MVRIIGRLSFFSKSFTERSFCFSNVLLMATFASNHESKIMGMILDLFHFSVWSKGVGCTTIVNMETSKTSMFRFTGKSNRKCFGSWVGVLTVARTWRLRRFGEWRYATTGVSLKIFWRRFDALRMGRFLRSIFWMLGKAGLYVSTKGILSVPLVSWGRFWRAS